MASETVKGGLRIKSKAAALSVMEAVKAPAPDFETHTIRLLRTIMDALEHTESGMSVREAAKVGHTAAGWMQFEADDRVIDDETGEAVNRVGKSFGADCRAAARILASLTDRENDDAE